MNTYTLRVTNAVVWTFRFWLEITSPDGHLWLPLSVGYISNIMSALIPRHLSSYILLFSHSTPLPISFPPVAALQTSCASTASSIMRTCRRSPSTLWFVMLMPQDSRLERHSCHRGMRKKKKKKKTSIHILKRLCWLFEILRSLVPTGTSIPPWTSWLGCCPLWCSTLG